MKILIYEDRNGNLKAKFLSPVSNGEAMTFLLLAGYEFSEGCKIHENI
jgi:hypothetical protein